MDELLCQTNISANHGNPVKLDKRTRLLLLFKITRVLVLTKPQYTVHSSYFGHHLLVTLGFSTFTPGPGV